MNASDGVLWDVVEEHLDEAAFGLDQFDAMLEHPLLALQDLEQYPEARLLAHLDALVVGGEPVAERLLRPALAEPDPEEPPRLCAAALSLLLAGHHHALAPALQHEARALREAAVRAGALSRSAKLEPWARDRLREPQPPHALASLLELIAALGTEPPALLAFLQHENAEVVAAAARAARRAEARMHLPCMESLLEHEEPAVRDAVLPVVLAWGSQHAWALCQRWAFDRRRPHPLALSLYAALSEPSHHVRLTELLSSEPHRPHVLFALGFSGNAELLPALLSQLEGEPPAAKLALQAVALITGLDLRDDAFAASAPEPEATPELPPPEGDEEAQRALPPLERDDLDADLVPPPEDALPLPNVEAVARYCEKQREALDPQRRWLAGRPFGVESVLHQLEHGPLRTRHVLSLSLAIRTRGQVWFDTRAFTAHQRAELVAVRALSLRALASPFSRF